MPERQTSPAEVSPDMEQSTGDEARPADAGVGESRASDPAGPAEASRAGMPHAGPAAPGPEQGHPAAGSPAAHNGAAPVAHNGAASAAHNGAASAAHNGAASSVPPRLGPTVPAEAPSAVAPAEPAGPPPPVPASAPSMPARPVPAPQAGPLPVGPDAPAEPPAAAPRTAPAGPDPADRVTDVLPPVEADTGEVLPAATAVAVEEPPADGDAPTELIPVARDRTAGRRRRRALLLTGAVVGLLAALYVTDLVLNSGTVPRGVTVAGQDVGGLTEAAAEQRVRAAVEPRTVRPVDVAVGQVTSQIDPRAAGLSVDWGATIAQAGSQPLNPVTRIRSFFTRREVGVVSKADDESVDTALQQLAPVVNKPPVEGTVRFEGTSPVPVPPVDGQDIDLSGARTVLERDWTSGSTVQLPVTVLHPTTTEDDVTKALHDVATPAVSGPVTVVGEHVTGTITPEVVATALSFRADPAQGLVPELNKAAIQEALDPQMASSEQPGRDATLTFTGGKPVVTPSQDGRGVDYDATLKDLVAVLTKTGDERRITAVYAAQPADLTTDELKGLGISGVIGEFSTGGFAQDSGQNIRRAAQVINGMIVKPGETFSLNGATEPRDAAHGYIEAGIISEGHASRGVGGGVSQVATTLYNAAYFAGMTDVTHKPHSFYISRYPPGREATVFEGAIDLKFRNDNPTGVLIQTAWTPTSLTIRLYGTKRYDVSSSTGPRTNPTEPTRVEIPAGQPCTPSQGAPGFTVTDTRTLRDVKTGQVKTERRTTKYNPSPIVTCGGR
jgi:vancomycin resistance protein YoaR